MAAIAAETATSELDWRLDPDRAWEPFELAEPEAERCRALLTTLGLRFGGIDLAQDDTGRLWFLEINPNGEWGWLSELAELPIVGALCDELSLCGADGG
jgi:glutathione synthase/RimK-type ligase-like ATP-grasp enzyme